MALKTKLCFPVLFILLPLLILNGFTQPQASAAGTAVPIHLEIPLELVRGHLIMVKGSIGGIDDLNVIVDTGASMSVVSRRLADKLRCEEKDSSLLTYGREIEAWELVLPEVRFGELVFEKVPALVTNLAFFHGVRIDALVGLNLLRRTSLLIDYERRSLTFGAAGHFPSKMAFSARAPVVLMRMTVGETELALILDTGSPELILYKGRIEGRLDCVRTKASRTLKNAGGSIEVREVRLPHIKIKRMEWKDVGAKIIEVPADKYGTLDGVLGPLSLGIKPILVDFESGLVSWSL